MTNEVERELAREWLISRRISDGFESLADLLARYGAEQRLEEAKWWGDPKRENGPRTLYSSEQERLATLAAAAQPKGEGSDESST